MHWIWYQIQSDTNGVSSSIVEAVDAHCRTRARSALCYFFFDFNDKDKQSPELLISTLLVQLSAQSTTVMLEVVKFKAEYSKTVKHPQKESLVAILLRLLDDFNDVFIVLDALDECDDYQELCTILFEIVISPKVHLLATSRWLQFLEQSFNQLRATHVTLKQEGQDLDIRLYTSHVVSSDVQLRQWPTVTQARIEKVLSSKARGM